MILWHSNEVMAVPNQDELYNPLLKAFHKLGGSASVREQEDEVSVILDLSDKDLGEIHRGNRTKVSYRLAWARNSLKRYGILENTSRGVWALTAKGHRTESVDPAKVNRVVTTPDRKRSQDSGPKAEARETVNLTWEEQLLECIRSMAPDGFERLCQRLLRASGFIRVEVTGRSGDGGIDGKGVVQIGGLLSFHMIFQCKRFKGSVSSSAIRDFRGAMVGRADKGLFITTGSFTADAIREAQRDGAPPLDLIDGEALVQKLKELELGVTVSRRTEEDVRVDQEFFDRV